jgi:hypothetical protein
VSCCERLLLVAATDSSTATTQTHTREFREERAGSDCIVPVLSVWVVAARQ